MTEPRIRTLDEQPLVKIAWPVPPEPVDGSWRTTTMRYKVIEVPEMVARMAIQRHGCIPMGWQPPAEDADIEW